MMMDLKSNEADGDEADGDEADGDGDHNFMRQPTTQFYEYIASKTITSNSVESPLL